jgi:hypothetical protein
MQIIETMPNRYDVIWRTPLLSGMRLPIVLKFPANVRNITEPAGREFPGSLVERRLIATDDGLAGKRIEEISRQRTPMSRMSAGGRACRMIPPIGRAGKALVRAWQFIDYPRRGLR